MSKCHSDQDALRDFLAAPEDMVLDVEVGDGFCVCDMLLPKSFKLLTQWLRSVVMTIANSFPGSAIRIVLYRLAGAKIGNGVYISPYVVVDPLYPQLLTIEDDVLLGLGCRLLTHEYTSTRFRLGRIRLKKGCVIGAYSTVRSGVTIGECATVGMNSLANKDVAAGDTVGGVPAKPLRTKEGGA